MRIGVDLVDIERIANLVERSPRFARRTFTAHELTASAQMQGWRRKLYLAGRFAVKEAALKALGVGVLSNLAMTEIETLTSTDGGPRLTLRGNASKLAKRQEIREFYVSISHERRIAVAFVILL
jgi:holo-[acyl-carrier protein] synthase